MKQVKHLSESDAGYLAGLIDGEGTVTLTRRHKNRQPELVFSISSTERQLLEFALDRFGVGQPKPQTPIGFESLKRETASANLMQG